MLCDFHVHLADEPRYADALAETARNMGFDKLCIGGGDACYGLASNEEALRCAQSYPELFVPFARVHLGVDGPHRVEELCALGFKGLRVAGASAPYDAAEFFPVYEAACVLGMPVLFHTGLLPVTSLDRALDVRCGRVRPIHLDTLARQLPDLKIVGSGLGRPWYEEAAEILRRHENVFFDLSGHVLRQRGTAFFRGLLSVEGGAALGQAEGHSAWSKIVFGSAVPHEEIASVERDYERLFRALALPEAVIADIMGGNAARLLGLAVRA